MRKLQHKQKIELQSFVKSSKNANEIKRAQTILMLDEKNGLPLAMNMTGYGKTQAYDIKNKYLKQGIASLTDRREGKPKELLTKKQREKIVQTVSNKTPRDLGYVSEHWSVGLLGNWIKKEFKVEYKSKTSLYLVFKQAKFTYHRPGQAYDLRDEEAIEAWKQENKPALQRFWKQENTVILCADEMVLTTATTIQKVWLPQGEFPKITCKTGGRKRRNVYGFLNLKTGDEHAFKTNLQNMRVTRDVLKKVRKVYPTQKIVLYWDNAGWHRGSVVQEWIKKDGNIKIIHFPTYAPELNPQEHVWKSGRSAVTHNRYIEDIDEATDGLIRYFKGMTFSYSLLGFCSVS